MRNSKPSIEKNVGCLLLNMMVELLLHPLNVRRTNDLQWFPVSVPHMLGGVGKKFVPVLLAEEILTRSAVHWP